jgi:DNA polymerase-1
VTFEDFSEIWSADFEFDSTGARQPVPVCFVATELRSGRTIRQRQGEFSSSPPFDFGPRSLYVAFTASAELGCHIALGWPMPERVLDLYPEYCNMLNGLPMENGRSLLGALDTFGLSSMGAARKASMREFIMKGGPWTEDQWRDILDYCWEDVDAVARLLPRMQSRIDLPRALLRGRYMAAVAWMEWVGIPIDVETLDLLREHWDGVKEMVVAEIDRDYGVFDGVTFRQSRFKAYLARNRIPWPRLLGPDGRLSDELDLSEETFKVISKSDARIAPLREVRTTLAKLRLLTDLRVGPDGRNRLMLSTFKSSSSRNQPSTSKFIFGPSRWLRSLIKPEPGMALAYIDWQAQELGIAAALSGDPNMKAAYCSGDPYLAFAKQAGAVPSDGTKATHARERELYKTVVLGVGYGQEYQSIASRLGITGLEARELLLKHHETYPRFWRWSEDMADQAMLRGYATTVLGWRVRPGRETPKRGPGKIRRSLRNFPMQSNGAEMLRVACCLATERGVRVCAPVHDAVLIEAPSEQIEHAVATMRAAMAEASRLILNGFELRTDAETIRYPDRYVDPRGRVMWDRTMRLIRQRELGVCLRRAG